MIKKLGLKFYLFLLAIFLINSIGMAEEKINRPTCAFTWTFYSDYIWQGLDLSKASSFLFPSLASKNKLGLNFFELGNEFSNNFPDKEKIEGWENNGILAYQDHLSLNDQTAINWKLGWANYDTRSGEKKDVFAGLSLDAFLYPEVSFWKGIDVNDEEWRINLALSHSWDLSKYLSQAEGWTLGLGSGVSYLNREKMDYREWENANLWADLNIPFNKDCLLTPSINYSFPMHRLEKNNLSEEGHFTGLESSFVFGGISLKIPF